MLKPTYVAEQIVKSMQTKKREVNLPKWMGIGPKLYALFPGLFERVAGKSLSKNRRFPYGNLLFYPQWAVRPPPQNSAKAKKLGGDQLPIKSDCSTNNQWG